MPRKIAIHAPIPKAKRSQKLFVRETSWQHGYDADWKVLRLAFLAEHPLCQCDRCKEGKLRLTKANVVNHIIDIRDRPDLRLVWDNLQSMNKICHDRHTRIKMNEQMRSNVSART